MRKRYKYKKPTNLGTVSPVPFIYLTPEAIETMNIVNEIPNRLERGRELFLLEMASIIRDKVRDKAPPIKMGDETVDYAEQLRIGLVSGVADEQAVVIYLEGTTTIVGEEQMGNTVLFIRNTQNSPLWVGVLARYGPWPARMLPVPMRPRDGKIISRTAREDEIRALTKRLIANKTEIETNLSNAGATNAKVQKSSAAVGVVVNEDIGYNVLRKEFGYDGSPQVSHWRPALGAVKKMIPRVAEKFMTYLQTGQEKIFDLPNDIKSVNKKKITEGEGFQEVLAPFAPKG